MTTAIHDADTQRELRNLSRLAGAAIVATALAVLAGLVLWLADPAPGSRFEGALGITAATSGLSVAVFAVAAAIYAQVKNLWRFVPTWIRSIAWTFIVIGIVVTVLNLISQLLSL